MGKVPKILDIKAVLPEVMVEGGGLLKVRGGAYYTTTGVWDTPEAWRVKAMNYLAIAEYLESLKPKLPTEPGSVILATKVNGYALGKDGDYLVLHHSGFWKCIDGCSVAQAAPQDIEEWVPVKLVPQVNL